LAHTDAIATVKHYSALNNGQKAVGPCYSKEYFGYREEANDKAEKISIASEE